MVPARIPAIARRCSTGRASIAFHASLTRSGSVAAAQTDRAIGCPAPRTCSMAFTIAGMLLGSKASTILNLIRLALRTTFPSVFLCGLSAFVLDRRFVQFACDKINEGSEFGRKKMVRRVNCGNPRFILRGIHFAVSQNNFGLTTVKVLFHDPSARQELPEPPMAAPINAVMLLESIRPSTDTELTLLSRRRVQTLPPGSLMSKRPPASRRQ